MFTKKPTKKILVVDDDEATVQTLWDILKKMGYSVEIARDGQQVLGKLSKFVPDLILLDIMMPKMDGLKLIQVLRRSPAGLGIKIIVITALLISNLITELEKYDVKSMRKPIDIRKLLIMIKGEIG